jgi:hypothetical protein
MRPIDGSADRASPEDHRSNLVEDQSGRSGRPRRPKPFPATPEAQWPLAPCPMGKSIPPIVQRAHQYPPLSPELRSKHEGPRSSSLGPSLFAFLRWRIQPRILTAEDTVTMRLSPPCTLWLRGANDFFGPAGYLRVSSMALKRLSTYSLPISFSAHALTGGWACLRNCASSAGVISVTSMPSFVRISLAFLS